MQQQAEMQHCSQYLVDKIHVKQQYCPEENWNQFNKYGSTPAKINLKVNSLKVNDRKSKKGQS